MVASGAMFGGMRGFLRDDGFRAGPETRRLELVCLLATLIASVGFALCAFWELADTFSAGHYAASSAVCTSSENMWRWGILAPVPHYTLRQPMPSEYYCHHPWGIFWVTAVFMKVFGHHAWACRLPAALQSALTPPALYLAGRALWGPVAGAVAALSFAVVPIALSFSDLNGLEVPVVFGTVVAVWGYARFRHTYLRRFLALGLSGLVYAVCCDWAAMIFAAVTLGAVFVSVFLLKRWTPVADRRRIAGFCGLGAALCTIAVGAHLYTFQHFGQLNELFAQGSLRSAGAQQPLSQVLQARRFWIEVSFTGLAIALGKFALPVLGLRVLLRRSELEVLPLAVFAMALAQYVVFKQGADIHVFWPFYFAEYFAFACAGLTQSALGVARRIAASFPQIPANFPSYACLGVGLLVPLVVLPDGLRALEYAHRSGGRFNENGHPTKPDKDKVAVLEWLTTRMAPSAGVTLHPGMRQSLWVDWSMQRPAVTVNRLPTTAATGQDRYYVADMRFMSAGEQESLAQNFSITALGTFLTVDRAAAKGDFRAFEVQRYEPSLLQSYWVSSTHALRRIAPNPYLGWELRDRFGVSPNEPPTTAPVTFEDLRVAHNIAVARGDVAGAAHWLEALMAGCDRHAQRAFDDGDELLGSRLEHGTSFVYSLYFRAADPDPSEPELALHSVVEAAPTGSLVPKDSTLGEVGVPFAIPTSRWKRGYVYASITEIIQRIGRERWYGSFRPAREAWSRDPAATFDLLRLD
jgi:Dolichyl-phosphate-mannose-protein mannosyltransferase